MQKKESYAELLRSPLWQKKRLEIMERDNFTCQHCGCTHKDLQVHHREYIKGRKPWEYEDDNLVTLCEDCHKNVHEETNQKLMNVTIGNVYRFDHSEFTDYLICYKVDYIKKMVFLFGVDNGSGFNSGWFVKFPYDEFYKRCKLYDQMFTGDIFEDYFDHSLLYVIYHSTIGDVENVDVYDAEVDDLFDLHKSIGDMRKNNKNFKYWFDKAKNGEIEL